MYSTYLGESDTGWGIALDTSGNAYVTGVTWSATFPTTADALQRILGGGWDAFVVKLNASGSALLYSSFLGGSGLDEGVGIAVDASSNAYVIGFTESSNFPTSQGSLQVYYGGGVSDGFVSKFSLGGPTGPVISGMPVAGCSLWPPNHKLVQVADVKASDAQSGLAPGSFKVTGFSNEPSNPSDPDVVIRPDGSGGFIVQLRADRLGTGNGRVYTINATAMDNAGNSATATSVCTVPHDRH